MVCYRDMTFCETPCANKKCFRKFTEEDSKNAKKWWGGDDYPLAISYFGPTCRDYISVKETK